VGARVIGARRVYGGYGPSATFRLRLDDGQRAFFKGVNRDANDVMRWALGREQRVYEAMHALISPWAPQYFGALRHEDWHVLLLEDVGPANVPPWTPLRARTAMRSYADFHASTVGMPLPRWLPRGRSWAGFGGLWRRLAEEPGGVGALASLAGDRRPEASAWLDAALPALSAASEKLARARPPFALLHLDTRSDNVRLTGSLLRIFDWPYACAGPAELDVAAFAQSIVSERGPSPEEAVDWYAERRWLRDALLDASVSAVAGYFANQSWRPPVAGLPRLRSVQRRQLKASLPWAARRLELPHPGWIGGVPD
jgi:hypothetical protein